MNPDHTRISSEHPNFTPTYDLIRDLKDTETMEKAAAVLPRAKKAHVYVERARKRELQKIKYFHQKTCPVDKRDDKGRFVNLTNVPSDEEVHEAFFNKAEARKRVAELMDLLSEVERQTRYMRERIGWKLPLRGRSEKPKISLFYVPKQTCPLCLHEQFGNSSIMTCDECHEVIAR